MYLSATRPQSGGISSHITWMGRFAMLLSVLAIAACGGGGGGDSGGSTNTGGSANDNPYGLETPPDPTLSSIQAEVFTPICTECHAGASAPQGLRLEEGMSYGMLVNIASSEVPSVDRVEPGEPDNSYLIRKLEGTASVGERMPLGGPYLPQDTINAIRQWITDGATDNKPMSSAKPSTGPASSAPASLAAAWPVNDSVLPEFPNKMLVIADAELDATLLNARSIQLFRESENMAKTPLDARIRVTSLAPTVLEVSAVNEDLPAGKYTLRIFGSGHSPVADRQGRLVDGDSDGKPGGDFVMRFEVEAKQ